MSSYKIVSSGGRWIAWHSIDGESDECLGVFSSLSEATQAIDDHEQVENCRRAICPLAP